MFVPSWWFSNLGFAMFHVKQLEKRRAKLLMQCFGGAIFEDES